MTQKLIPANAVSSFFFYMWNTWCEEECKIVFDNHRHFWDKWCGLTKKDAFGATEKFYSELSDTNRELLVNRAVSVYDGKAKRMERTLHQIREDALQGISENVKTLYDTIVIIVENQGGLVNTQDESCDTIYSIEYLSIDNTETVERAVKGIRVKDQELQVFNKDPRPYRTKVTDDELRDPELDDNWLSVKDGCEVIYIHTLLNIAEFIEQYL